MTIDIDKLRAQSDRAHQKAYELQAEKDDALEKLRAKYDDKCREATDAAAAAQKELLDAEVAMSLTDRDDGPAVARSLVEQGSLSADVVKAAGITLD